MMEKVLYKKYFLFIAYLTDKKYKIEEDMEKFDQRISTNE